MRLISFRFGTWFKWKFIMTVSSISVFNRKLRKNLQKQQHVFINATSITFLLENPIMSNYFPWIAVSIRGGESGKQIQIKSFVFATKYWRRLYFTIDYDVLMIVLWYQQMQMIHGVTFSLKLKSNLRLTSQQAARAWNNYTRWFDICFEKFIFNKYADAFWWYISRTTYKTHNILAVFHLPHSFGIKVVNDLCSLVV